MPEVLTLAGTPARTEDGGYPEVIKVLQDALEEARNGTISVVGLIVLRPNRQIDTYCSKQDSGRHELLAGCMYLADDLIRDRV